MMRFTVLTETGALALDATDIDAVVLHVQRQPVRPDGEFIICGFRASGPVPGFDDTVIFNVEGGRWRTTQHFRLACWRKAR